VEESVGEDGVRTGREAIILKILSELVAAELNRVVHRGRVAGCCSSAAISL
jgi:hypothetical protein